MYFSPHRQSTLRLGYPGCPVSRPTPPAGAHATLTSLTSLLQFAHRKGMRQNVATTMFKGDEISDVNKKTRFVPSRSTRYDLV